MWIDSCCIDKTNNVELSEANNSMYRCYQNAQVCYVYLVDLSFASSETPGRGMMLNLKLNEVLRQSRWITRGWTLQELLASREIMFYNSAWGRIGAGRDMQEQLSLVTGIKHEQLRSPRPASLAQRMSWASKRRTTRLKDIAYCLIGIFDVNMPLLYGEGIGAFIRFQQEITKSTTNESIFAWRDRELVCGEIFALSPAAFEESGDVVRANLACLDRPDKQRICIDL